MYVNSKVIFLWQVGFPPMAENKNFCLLRGWYQLV